MKPEDNELDFPEDARIAAAIACGAIILGFVVYWAVQIQSVRELLALAYG